MSSNIGPEASAAYEKYLDASTLSEKVKRLEEFISLVPKHKATEKIVALNRSRLAKLKREQEERKQRLKSGRTTSPFSIKKEGIQLILISDFYTPGVGKTAILNFLTGAAKEKIGKYTSLPEVGIYHHNKIRFQIVDMPSLMEGASSGVGNGKEIMSQIRSCDLLCLCVDLSRNIEAQMNLMLTELSNADVRINESPPSIEIQKTGSNKIQVFYLTKEARENITLTDKIKELISESGIRNAIVKISGNISLDQVIDVLSPSVVYKKTIILATKGDLPNTEQAFKELNQKYCDKFSIIIGTSTKKEVFSQNFGKVILNFLEKIMIYTMNNGIIAEKPLIMYKFSTIGDAALKIHRNFYDFFEYAVVIRKLERQKRKRVGLDYELRDKDVIELHSSKV